MIILLVSKHVRVINNKQVLINILCFCWLNIIGQSIHLLVEQVLHKLGIALVLLCQTSDMYTAPSHHTKCIMFAGAKTANYKNVFDDKNTFLLTVQTVTEFPHTISLSNHRPE